MIKIRRLYDAEPSDHGSRFLVDRIWPRGMKKESLDLDGWLRDVAPSKELRQWFGHDPNKWEGFKHRYFEELENKPAEWNPILKAAQSGDVELLYSTEDPKYNNAQALQEFLNKKLEG